MSESIAALEERDKRVEAEGPTGGPMAAVRLLIGMAVVAGVFVAMGWTTLLLIILALIAMVLFHEWGHYITAKKTGMKVTEFFVGFGPRLWSFRRGETEYGVKAIPAGGYCRIIGMTSAEEVHPSDEPRAYRQQAFWKRIVVASAGSATHLILAFLLAFAALTLIGRPDPSVVTVAGYLSLDGQGSTPAEQAGLKPGDRIVRAGDVTISSVDQLSTVVHASADKPVTLVVERDGRERTLVATPVDGRSITVDGRRLAPSAGKPTGYLGVSLGEGSSTVGPLQAAADSGSIVKEATFGAVAGIAHLFSPSGLADYAQQVIHPAPSEPGASTGAQPSGQSSSRPESIIGAVRTADQAAKAGGLAVIEVFISINVFIGIINMLPMLPLDGGHVAIALYERIRTRRGRPRYQADVTKMMPVVYAFLAFLLVLVTTSMYLDIAHPAANPFR